MIIVADARPIISLEKLGELTLLRKVYGEIHITDIVADVVGIELPDWITVSSDYNEVAFESLSKDLDRGIASAIQFCLEQKNSTLIIDERKGRKIARKLVSKL